MPDVLISYEVLNELNGSLKQILVEFEDASSRTEDLAEAIGSPDGRSGLRDRVGDFESGWNDRRKQLAEDLKKVQERVEETGKSWEEWDTEASEGLSVDAGETANLPTAD